MNEEFVTIAKSINVSVLTYSRWRGYLTPMTITRFAKRYSVGHSNQTKGCSDDLVEA